MTITTRPLTNGAWWPRTTKPLVLAVLHITANTAPPEREWQYANRTSSPGPSATLYIGRDGNGIRALDPATQVAWSQGDVTKPDLSNPGVAALVALSNANRGVWESIECCAVAGQDWTSDQYATVAQVIADASKATGIAISRSSVLAHRDLNTVNRPSDPWVAAVRERNMANLIAQATRRLGMDLTSPATDTVDYLNQWLHTLKGEAPAGSFFAENFDEADDQVVQLTAAIFAAGTAYYRKGCVSRSVQLKAIKLMKAHPEFNLNPLFAQSLLSGQPLYARSIGVASEPI